MKKRLLTIVFLSIGALPYITFVLEDTYIFLAQARKFLENDQLVGTTSLAWGAVSVFVIELSSRLSIDSLILLKSISFILWLVSFFVLKNTLALFGDLPKRKYFTLLFLYIILPISSSWAFSGMDVSLSILFFSIWMHQVARHIQHNEIRSYYYAILFASFVYLVRPELVWLGLFFIAFDATASRGSVGNTGLVKGTLLWIVGTAVSFTISFLITGQLFPTSANKIFSPGIFSLASAGFFLLVNGFMFMPTYFLKGNQTLSTQSLVSFYSGFKKNNVLSLFIILLIALRLLEHLLIGHLDHRVLAYLLPAILILYFLSGLSLSKVHVAFFLVVALLNIYNFHWYIQRTEQVHLKVTQYLTTFEFDTLATEEIGILSYYLPDEIKIYDYHGLNGLQLSDAQLSDIEVAVFTGGLMKTELLNHGFEIDKTICYEHPVTLYIRGVAFSPRQYCKTIYVNKAHTNWKAYESPFESLAGK